MSFLKSIAALAAAAAMTVCFAPTALASPASPTTAEANTISAMGSMRPEVSTSKTVSPARQTSDLPKATGKDVANFESSINKYNLPSGAISQYRKLDEAQKAQFVAAITSPNPADSPGFSMTETQTITKTLSSPSSASGDARIAASAAASSPVYDVTLNYKREFTWWSIPGLTIGYFSQVYKYKTSAGKVVANTSCEGFTSGFTGVFTFQASDKMWISGGLGTCETTFKGSGIYKNSNISWNKRMTQVADGYNYRSKSLVNI